MGGTTPVDRRLHSHAHIIVRPELSARTSYSWVPLVKVVQLDLVRVRNRPAAITFDYPMQFLAIGDHTTLDRRWGRDAISRLVVVGVGVGVGVAAREGHTYWP